MHTVTPVPSPVTDRERALSIGAAILACVAVGIGLGLSIPLLAFELESRGVSSTLIGLNTAIAGIATAIVAPAVPHLVARFGVRPFLLATSLAGGLSLIGFHFAEAFWLWFPLRFVAGAAVCVVFVVSEFWINSAAPPHRRGAVMGLYATVLSLGFAAGPAILALTGPSGLLPYVAGALLFMLPTIPVALAGHLAPRLDGERPRSAFRFLLLAPSATLAALVFGAVETGAFNFLPLYGTRQGLDETSASLILTVMLLGNVLFQIPLGWLSDRVDRRLVLFFCGLIGVAGALAMLAVPPSSPAFLALVFVWGGIVASLYTVGLAHLGARFSGADLAAANAAFVMLYAVGFTLGPPALGAAMDAWNPFGFAAGLAALLGAYTLTVLVRRILVPGRG